MNISVNPEPGLTPTPTPTPTLTLALAAQPVVIIGAGRSGTNLLRDVLSQLAGVDTWPCDEINYIWRHGNRAHPTDEFTAAHATENVTQFIRSSFAKRIRQSDLSNYPEGERFILEKTCANSLRVPFVDAVLPEARYIFLVRDGRDVVASARKRWQAPLDIPYLLSKARYVPPSDLSYYASRYLNNRLSRRRSKDNALAVWGPRFEGMAELGKQQSLDHVCAHQWVRCMELAERAFTMMDSAKCHQIYYEQLVSEPVNVMSGIAEFLGMKHSTDELAAACSQVHTSSVGKGKMTNEANDSALSEIMKPVLVQHGYR